MELGFERDGKIWKLATPASTAIRQERVQQLVDGLAHLRADAVLARGEEASAFGLSDAAALVSMTVEPSGDAVEPRVLELRVGQHDGRYVAQLVGRPTIYAIPEAV